MMMERFEKEIVKLDDLVPAEYNPREIKSENFEALKASLREFGLVEPLIKNPNTGNMVGGHQRLRALKELREEGAWSDDVEVALVPLSPEREKILNAVLNNKHTQGEFTKSVSDLLDEVSSGADVSALLEDLRLDEVRLDFIDEVDLSDVSGDDFEPKPDMEPPRLDKKKPVTCPECGHEFTTP
jgi:ParB-like chromosome segregation protein Spo0J